jgi:hypothetical protein
MCSLWIVYYKDKFIIAINYFFLLLAVFRFILNKLPLNDIKYQLCYLKRCLYTQKFYLFIVTRFFFIITCSFSVFFENCILLPKGIDEFTNNKNLGKRIKNHNHTCTIHRNTTNSKLEQVTIFGF